MRDDADLHLHGVVRIVREAENKTPRLWRGVVF
jgi:hypothetical protein